MIARRSRKSSYTSLQPAPVDELGVATRRLVYAAWFVALVGLTAGAQASMVAIGPVAHFALTGCAALFALFAGVVVLLRHRSKPESFLRLIGSGLICIAVLEGYQAVEVALVSGAGTEEGAFGLTQLARGWLASRLAYAALMFGAVVVAYKQVRADKRPVDGATGMPLLVSGGTVAVFVLVQALPTAAFAHADGIVARPLELIPAFGLCVALAGLYRLGSWRTSSFDHWLVVSLGAGAFLQVAVMPFSARPLDANFALAHVLNLLCFVAVAIGALKSNLETFKDADERNQRLRAILDTAAELILTVDGRGRILHFNAAAATALGYSEDEFRALPVSAIIPSLSAAVQSSGPDTDFDFACESRDAKAVVRSGRSLPIELTVKKITQTAQPRFICFARDVTEDERAAEVLRRRNQELASIARQSRAENAVLGAFSEHKPAEQILDDVLGALSREYGFRPCSAYLADDWRKKLVLAASIEAPPEYSRSFSLGEGLVGAAAGDRQPRFLHKKDVDMPLRLYTGVGEIELTSIIVLPVVFDNRTMAVLVMGSPTVLPDSEEEFLVALSLQLAVALQNYEQHRKSQSLSRQLEERQQEIEEKNRELLRANQMKSEFLANMSHELRTPLNAIIGFSEILRDGMVGALNSKQAEYASDIFSSGQHLLSLINDILDLSKIEAGKMVLHVEEVVAEEILDRALGVVKEKAATKQIRLYRHVAPAVSRFHADTRRLLQILFNLLANAVKFTPPGGQVGLEVDLDTRQSEPRVCFVVTDTGIGIAQEEQERLFKPFEQLDGSARREYEGTGLGLAMVKRLVDLHSGSVAVESHPGSGSRFMVFLPVKPRAHPVDDNPRRIADGAAVRERSAAAG